MFGCLVLLRAVSNGTFRYGDTLSSQSLASEIPMEFDLPGFDFMRVFHDPTEIQRSPENHAKSTSARAREEGAPSFFACVLRSAGFVLLAISAKI